MAGESPESRLVVIRPAPDLPAGFLGALDGQWLDLGRWRNAGNRFTDEQLIAAHVPGGRVTPTDRFERRADLRSGRVYEVHA